MRLFKPQLHLHILADIFRLRSISKQKTRKFEPPGISQLIVRFVGWREFSPEKESEKNAALLFLEQADRLSALFVD
jgi:hypothetical protein